MRYQIVLAVTSALLIMQPKPEAPLSSVPLVGCPADGQQGPESAKGGAPRQFPIPSKAALQLAYYEYNGDSGNIGTLAPRGWNCFATIGSNGISLYVAPEPLNAKKILEHDHWNGLMGPAIQLSDSEGGTSGREEVARVIGRVFPAHRSFIRRVMVQQMHLPARDYLKGPYPSDRLIYRTKEQVEFVTPPHQKGLGTMSWLLPSDQPIYGVASLSTTDDWGLEQLNMRLAPAQRSLIPVLIREDERPAPVP